MKFLNSLISPIKQIENEELSFKLGFWKAFGCICIYMIIETIFSEAYTAMFPETFLLDHYYIMLGAEILAIPAISVILVNTFSKQTWVTNSYKKVDKSLIGYMTLLIIAFRLIYDVTLSPIINLIPQGDLLTGVESFLDSYPTFMIYFIISAMFIAPIIEEIVLRGVILNGMLNKYSPKSAIIISALIFAVIHGNIHQGVNAFILGVLFGYIYYKTRSLYLTMFCHFVNNSFAMFGIIPETTIGFIINLVVSLIIGIGILLFLKKNLKFSYESNFISTLKNPDNDTIYSSIN
ncbi:MAG: lysostaphin resistance A-like protein [Clostridium sp.]